MGIDMYLQWPDMTDDERAAQNTCSLLDGRVGYLRGPKATTVLAPEAFEPVVVPDDVEEDAFWEAYLGVPIRAATLRARLDDVRGAVVEEQRIDRSDRRRRREKSRETQALIKSYEDFVQLAEEKERVHGQVFVLASY